MSANKAGVNRKIPLHQSQPIPTIINLYTVLDNLQNKFQSPQGHEHVNKGNIKKQEFQIHSQTKKEEDPHNRRLSCESLCLQDIKLPWERI